MYFLYDENFINGAVAQDLQRTMYPHDSHGHRRRLCLADLCYYTVIGHDSIQDAKELAHLLDIGLKQAEIVWNVCIKHGVLRPGQLGYSAKPWMIEHGLFRETARFNPGTNANSSTNQSQTFVQTFRGTSHTDKNGF